MNVKAIKLAQIDTQSRNTIYFHNIITGIMYLDMLQMFLISLVKDNDAQGESTAQRDVVPSCARQIQELQLLNNPKLNSV